MTAFQGSTWRRSPIRKCSFGTSSFAKNFKDLTRDRLAMNAKLEPQERPEGHGDRGQAQGPDLDEHGQAAPLRGDHVPQNYTGLNIVLDPKALADEGLSNASPVSLVVNQVKLKTALKLLLQPLGLTYKLEDDVILITSPHGDAGTDVSQDLLCRRPGHAAGSRLLKIYCPTRIFEPGPQNPSNDPNAGFGPNPGVFGPATRGTLPASTRAGSRHGRTAQDRHDRRSSS